MISSTTAAPKKKGKTGRASVTNSPALHSTAFPPLDDDEEQAYLLKMEENDNDGDYTAGGAGKPKKPAPGSKKPVSSSSTTGAAGKQQAPVSGGASKAGAGAKEKGKETKRSGSMKIEDSEEALFTAEKRGARGRAGSSKKVVEEVEEKEEELVEEDPEEEDDGVTRCVCDEDSEWSPAFAREGRLADLACRYRRRPLLGTHDRVRYLQVLAARTLRRPLEREGESGAPFDPPRAVRNHLERFFEICRTLS